MNVLHRDTAEITTTAEATSSAAAAVQQEPASALFSFFFRFCRTLPYTTLLYSSSSSSSGDTLSKNIMLAGGQEPRKRNQEKNGRKERKIGHCFLLVLFAGCQGGGSRLKFCFTACPTVASKVHIGIHIQFTESCLVQTTVAFSRCRTCTKSHRPTVQFSSSFFLLPVKKRHYLTDNSVGLCVY